jgi:hypothetical protein
MSTECGMPVNDQICHLTRLVVVEMNLLFDASPG